VYRLSTGQLLTPLEQALRSADQVFMHCCCRAGLLVDRPRGSTDTERIFFVRDLLTRRLLHRITGKFGPAAVFSATELSSRCCVLLAGVSRNEKKNSFSSNFQFIDLGAGKVLHSWRLDKAPFRSFALACTDRIAAFCLLERPRPLLHVVDPRRRKWSTSASF
jgi:hypothetical protein